MRPVVGGRSGEDAVVIIWIALRFHQGLAAAIRTTQKIGILRSFAEARADDFLGDGGHSVNRTVAEVGDLLRMAEGPGGVCAFGGVASIRICSGVSSEKRSGEVKIVDLAGEAAVAMCLEFSIPVFGGKPN